MWRYRIDILRKIPRQKRAQELLDSVFTASSNVLNRLRFKDFSTVKVAEEAGVSVGSLYQYFRNKDGLIAYYIENQLDQQTKIFAGKIDEWKDLSLPEFNRRFVEFVADYLLKNSARLRVLYIYAGQFNRVDLLMRLRHTLIEKLASFFESRREELHVTNYHLAATVLVHACMGVLTAKMLDIEMTYDRETLTKELTELVESYLMGFPKPVSY